ncbi:hypothetical protein WJX81_002002 [Elliptochloris bilobata]|uniref:Equilibrative nucleoside transporter n=1 Tax=Elliptochloris bilobata TaxID=381761 RepID=A0AAW1RET1_9CHLO
MGLALAALNANAAEHTYKAMEIQPKSNRQKAAAGHNAAVVIYFLCGNAVLLPWNAFITAVDYFGSTYPGLHTDRLFTVCYLPLAFLTLVVSTVLHDHSSARLRVLVSFGAFFLTVLAVPLIDAGTHGQGSSGSLAAVCCLLALGGVLDGMGQGALFGTAAALGPLFVEALVAGTAMSGILVSVLRVITKAAYSDTRQGLRVAAAAYFGVAAFFVLACFFLFAFVLPRLPFIKQQQRAASEAQQDVSDLAIGDQDQKLGATSLRGMGRAMWVLAATIVLIYVVTLAIFPGVLAEDVSNSWLGSWYPVILILIYNLGDFAGKMTPVLVPAATVTAPAPIFACAAARLAFVPAYYFAARAGVAPAMMVLTGLLGISNGLTTVWAMVAAPTACATAKSKDLAGNVMITCLVFGLLLGSGCSFFWLIGRGW